MTQKDLSKNAMTKGVSGPSENSTSREPDKKAKSKNMKKSKKNSKSVPQKGDPDYLSPTQLRNRRKRRAKQQQHNNGTSTNSGNDGSKKKGGGGGSSGGKTNDNKKDPSMKYISNPIKAPIVQAAKKYFSSSDTFKDSKIDFHVHLGPLYEWRTVSKLAVRAEGNSTKKGDAKPKVAIGLFLPQTHTLLPVPNCRAHHPSINTAVECVTKACHEVGIVPYQEAGENVNGIASDVDAKDIEARKKVEKGSGQLRYVAINVARDTGASQLTLVWNGPAPCDDGSGSKRKYGNSIEDPDLEKLVAGIISMHVDANAKKDGEAAESIEEPMKKRRRRGRRGGKTDDVDASYNKPHSMNDGNEDRKSSDMATEEQSTSNGLRLNLHSLWINYNPSWKHSNAIFAFDSSCWKHVHGPSAVIERLTFGEETSKNGGEDGTNKSKPRKSGSPVANPPLPEYEIPLNFPPNVFRQANLDEFTHIVGRIREKVLQIASKEDGGKDSKKLPACVELYGGVGTIGLHLSDAVSSLVSSDENPNNAKCFNDSVGMLPSEIQSRLSYKQKNAADMISTEKKLLKKSQILVVDPPRKGLDAEVVDYLCTDGWKNLELMVYVSCGFQAFQQNCDALVNSGHWKVEFAEGYLLFPGSDAIETLAFFVPVK